MSAPSPNGHFPTAAWWREKLRTLGEYLKRADPAKPQPSPKEKP